VYIAGTHTLHYTHIDVVNNMVAGAVAYVVDIEKLSPALFLPVFVNTEQKHWLFLDYFKKINLNLIKRICNCYSI